MTHNTPPNLNASTLFPKIQTTRIKRKQKAMKNKNNKQNQKDIGGVASL
jgi:hypothetical protein